jgi:trans-aconitate methyltransferase
MNNNYIYWKNRTTNWINDRTHNPGVSLEYVNYINKYSNNDSLCLEIGCGTGHYLSCINSKYIYGIDFMNDFINYADKIKPNNCSVYTIDISKQKFMYDVDLIYSCVVLQHISSGIENAINNICSLNAKDIIIFECTDNSFKNNSYLFCHNYDEYFNKNNYSLYHKKLLSNNITYVLHYKKNII